MSKTLEIFALCERLAMLLGDKEAIADLQRLYARHPEMFRDMQEVSEVIGAVVCAPEIMTNANREGAILVAKRLKEKHKMGEVAIENDNGTNIIFHANQKKMSEFNRLERNLFKNTRLLVETPSAKAAPTRLDRCADKSNLSKDSKAPSTADTRIIPQNTNFSANISTKSTDDIASEKGAACADSGRTT